MPILGGTDQNDVGVQEVEVVRDFFLRGESERASSERRTRYSRGGNLLVPEQTSHAFTQLVTMMQYYTQAA